MLSFVDSVGSSRLTRRSFLRCGAAALGGALAAELGRLGLFGGASQALAGAVGGVGASPVSGKSVIFLFMQGGPPQHETFDPKIDLPAEQRSVGGSIPTSVPGVHFGDALPRLAKLAHKLAVVRNFSTGTDHGGLRPIVSETTGGASLGAVYSRVAGINHPETGLPRSMALWPVSVGETLPGPRDRFGKFDVTGSLGPGYAPFTPGAGGAMQENLKIHLPRERLEDRRSLLDSLDHARAYLDTAGDAAEGYRRQAYDMLIKGVGEAFDLSKEDPRLIERYDTAGFLNPKLWTDEKGKKKTNDPWYTAHSQSLGKLLLLARRLAEAGCGFITVNTEFVWDFHADGNNIGIEAGKQAVIAPFDHAVSAFIEDCEARGLGEKILLVCCGEMGRNPKINKGGGRDHWPALAPLMLYGGGGLAGGKVIGRSNRTGAEPDGDGFKPDNLLATIFRQLFDLGQLRVTQGVPEIIRQAANRVEQIPGVL